MDGDLAQAVGFLRMMACGWIRMASSSKIDICSFIMASVYSIS